MKTTLPEKAAKVIDAKINELVAQLKEDSNLAAKHTVSGAERARRLGIYFQERCGHEQMTLTFFQNNGSNWTKEVDFGFVQKCIHLARTHSEPIKTLEEAKQASQLLFQAFGHLSESHRLTQQNASTETPVSWMLNAFSGITARLKKFEREVSLWDALTKQSAKEEIQRQIATLQQWEAKL